MKFDILNCLSFSDLDNENSKDWSSWYLKNTNKVNFNDEEKMNKGRQLKLSIEALIYVIDCTLATVEHMATLKSKSKSEYYRQIDIAQHGIDSIIEINPDSEFFRIRGGRVETIINGKMKVKEWAEQIE